MINYAKLQLVRFITLRAYRNGDWKTIPIEENNQSLVQVPIEISYPFYFEVMKISDSENIYLREEALEKIFVARSFLIKMGFDLRVYDGWRSMHLQENLFWYYMKLFTAKCFGKEKDFSNLQDPSSIKEYFSMLSPEVQSTMIEANRTYVSLPSNNPFCPSPHATGGAVDVWLFKDEKAANLGIPFDWMEEDAGAFYHLKFKRKRFPGNDRKVCKNRELLLNAMINAGFSCYGPEIWHFNYGNQMDALVKGGFAKYSYVEPQC